MIDPHDDGNRSATVRALLETVLHQMPGSVILAEAPSGRILLENDQVAKIWRDPSPGNHAPREGFHPDGSPYRHEEWPLNRTIATGEAVEGEEIKILRGDGTRGIVLVSSSPVRDSAGALVAAVATMYDVTEQKRAEADRRFLTEAASVLSSSLDSATTIRNLARLAVPTLADRCGVYVAGPGGTVERVVVEHADPARESVTRELAERFPPGPASAIHRAIATREPILIPEIDDQELVAAARSEEHLALLRALGLRSGMIIPLIARGSAVGAISLFSSRSGRRFTPQDLALAQDFAGRAALAIDNARLYDESQGANRAKSDFLAVMSHELRTPLTAIIGYTELMELGIPEPLTPRQKDQVQRVDIAAQHLLQLIEEILTMVSVEAGKETAHPAPILLSELLHRAEVIITPLAAEKKLELVFEPLDEEVEMEIDPDKAVQMVLNLLSNAVKFTAEGLVRVRARKVGETVEIEVRDTGVGVEPENLERIFEPFWQVEQPATRRAGGSGLGLAVSRRLADLLGGQLRVESEPGRGSTFTAVLPIHPPVQGEAERGST